MFKGARRPLYWSSMTKGLPDSAIERYRRNGLFFPIPVLTPAEARECRRRLEAIEATHAGELRHKPHLLFTWLADLVRHPTILDAVEDVLGPNLLVWHASFFIKEARDPAFVSWHQDATYWGLSAPDVMTAWLALTDATVENGAMRMVPGSHGELLAHRDTFAPHNLLSRGQEIAVDVDDRRGVDILLRAGEMSLHHVRMVHGSPPNRSADRRIGLAIRYIPTYVKQLAGEDSALLVRGVDEYHHFAPERAPTSDLSPEALAQHAEVKARSAKILYRDTGRSATLDLDGP
jgi:ectoine hydroxylase-related dioxygenase (phytanoyl-CoA dioxygenase family)